MTRVSDRRDFTEATRIRLLESDVDIMETNLKEGLDGVRQEIKGLGRVLIGILVALSTASLIGAANLLAGS